MGLLHDLGKVLALAGEPQVRPGMQRAWQGGAGQLRLRALGPHSVGCQSRATDSGLSVPSGRSLETPSRWAVVPRHRWFSVTPPSRTTLTSRTLDTGATPPLLPPQTHTPEPLTPLSPRSTELGMYQPHCGLENVLMSWGHDGEARWRPAAQGWPVVGAVPLGAWR